MRSLQRFFPQIKKSQFKNKSIYYLEDKNKQALQERMRQNKSRIISFQEQGNISKVFNTNLEINQKRMFLSKILKPKRYKINKFRKYAQFDSTEKQTNLDDFLGRFLHSEVLTFSYLHHTFIPEIIELDIAPGDVQKFILIMKMLMMLVILFLSLLFTLIMMKM